MKNLQVRMVAALFVLVAGNRAYAAEPLSSTAIPRDGASFPATLLRVEADGRVMLGVEGKPRTLASDQWIRWGSPATPAAGGPVVLTADGSVLPVDQQLEPLVLKAEKLSCDTRRLGRLELPLGSVRGVIFHGPLRSLEADLLLRQIVEAGGNSDQLILDNGDRLSGNLTDLGADKLKLEVEGRSLELEVRNVVAIIFNPTLIRTGKSSGQRLMVGLSDGTRLHCTAAASTGTTLAMTTLSGLELKTALANVVWLQPLGRDVTYLSDLEAAGFRHTPYLSLNWPYHRDRNVQGGQLRSGGRAYLKGLGLHSTSLISYTLPKAYRRLDAEIGIDDETANRGSVIFRVYVDSGDGQWQRRYESPIVRGGRTPIPISVDLKGAKRIGLLVDFADRGDELDHADWLDARLVP